MRTAENPVSMWSKWPALLALCLAMLVEMVDNTIFNVALPTIARDLSASTVQLQWINSAYSLTFGGLLILGGALGDFLGRRRMLLLGLGGFGLISSLVFFCDGSNQLIALRLAIGACAALTAPGTMSLIFRIFDDELTRGKAIGIIMIVSMAGFALGPIAAGLVLEHFSWRWLLFVNLPIAAVAMAGVLWGIRGDSPEEKRSGSIDIPSAAYSVVGMGAFLYFFSAAVERGFLDPITLGVLALALLSFTLFYRRSRGYEGALIPARIINMHVLGNMAVQCATMMCVVAAMFALTQHFQYVWGWSPLRAAFANLPFVVGMLAFAPLAESIISKKGHRVAAAIGSTLSIAGLLLIILGAEIGQYWAMALAIVVLVAGMRLVMTSSAVELMSSMPDEFTGTAASINDTSQEMGNSLGITVVGTAMAAMVGTALPQGKWGRVVIDHFIHAEQVSLLAIAGMAGVAAFFAVRMMSDSTSVEDH